jgi:hypothetical protein
VSNAECVKVESFFCFKKSKDSLAYYSMTMLSRLEYNFDGRLQLSIIGRLHVSVRRVEEPQERRRVRQGVKVDSDTTVDSNYFFNLITNETAPRIRTQFSAAEIVVLQLDNAPGHVGKNNSAEIERRGQR